MDSSTFLHHLEKQLERVRYSGLTHAQKDGALLLIESEIRDFHTTFQQDLYRETQELRNEAFEQICEAFNDIRPHVNPSGPLPAMLTEKQQKLRKLLASTSDLPF